MTLEQSRDALARALVRAVSEHSAPNSFALGELAAIGGPHPTAAGRVLLRYSGALANAITAAGGSFIVSYNSRTKRVQVFAKDDKVGAALEELEKVGSIEKRDELYYAIEWTCAPVDRSGASAYIHLIRAKNDPERPGAKLDKKRGWANAPEKRIKKTPVAEWVVEILKLLDDRRPRTFNAIAVELAGVTADVAFDSTLDRALWTVVEDHRVEHTLEAPILFRRRTVDQFLSECRGGTALSHIERKRKL